MENADYLSYLLKRYLNNEATPAERMELFEHIQKHPNDAEWTSLLQNIGLQQEADPTYQPQRWESMVTSITSTGHAANKPRVRFLQATWVRYAAAILILIAGSVIYFRNTPTSSPLVTANPVPVQNDILPGSDKATLTLSNGQKIVLHSTGQQTITDGTLSIHNKDGMLFYGKSNVVAYNTMNTPKGGQYKLTLPDGTNVWLNAESSITFPTSFPGKERVVSITGEAYFEVAKNPAKPFKVRTAENDIDVLGTHFNINAYPDEPAVSTTLLEGSVRIAGSVLHPGEQYAKGQIKRIDVTQAVGWKDGVFDFNSITLKEVLRQLSRWYDIDVKYPSTLADKRFGGKMERDLTLLQLLKLLDGVDMHFKLDGRTIVVTP